MSRLIIVNQSSIGDLEALRRVGQVLELGKISGKGNREQHCYATRLASSTGFCMVYASLNKNSERFTVMDT